MKLLFIQPPLEDFYTTPIRLYPLGLLYAASVARILGHEVEVHDCLAPLHKKQIPLPEDFHYLAPSLRHPLFFRGYYRFGCSDEFILERIARSKPDVVAISSQFTAYFECVARLIPLIKKHFDVKVIVGGNHATAFPAEITHRVPTIDKVLIGPAESSLVAYLQQNKTSDQSVDWRTVLPAHDLVSAQQYTIGKKTYKSIIASRGCPYFCQFCSVHAIFGRTLEYRRPESILAEMKYWYTQSGIGLFNFEDDNLTFNPRWFKTFLHQVIDEPMFKNIELTAANGICYPTLTAEILQLMWRAGFRRLDLSYVTHDEQLRRSYRRPDKNGNFKDIVQKAKEIGFFITAYVILGLPQQTYEEVRTTIDYLLDLGVLVGPSIFYIPPASEIYETLDIPETIRQNWNLYRSSAFAVETEFLHRTQLLDLFLYVRERNLERKEKV